jgi:hypothetical protein
MNGQGNTNVPVLGIEYQEVVDKLGYSNDWEKWDLCEAMFVHYQLYNVGPVVFINVFDPETMKKTIAPSDKTIENRQIVLNADAMPFSVVVKPSGGTGDPYVRGKDYTLSWNRNSELTISIMPGGAIPPAVTALSVGFDEADPSAVTKDDVIGGVDVNTGRFTGMEVIEQVFPKYRKVPGVGGSPKWSKEPDVAAILTSKMNNINGVFKGTANVDLPDNMLYTDAPDWKNLKNYTDPFQYVTYSKVTLGDKVFHLSTHAAGVIGETDADGSPDGIPFRSPSNQTLRIDGCIQDGKPLLLGLEQANYLNGNGITTALNWSEGWKLWGNRTGAFPDNPDPKDNILALRRMMNFIGNTCVLTFWNKVDDPTNRILIDNVVDTLNLMFSGWASRGYIAGARVAFRPQDNPTTNLQNGKVLFRIFFGGWPPAEDIEFMLEFDTSFLQTLFAA